MIRAKQGYFRSVRQLMGDDNGVSMVEFAFALPLMLIMIFGGLETANYALAHLRVSQIAMTVADNAGRVDTVIDEVNIVEVFTGAGLVGEQIDFESDGRIILSSLEPNGLSGGNAGQMIGWQRCFGDLARIGPVYGVEDDGRADSSLADGMGEAGNRITAEPGTAVMFVEASYAYEPLMPALGIIGAREIRYESAFSVRDRTNHVITNTQALPVNRC